MHGLRTSFYPRWNHYRCWRSIPEAWLAEATMSAHQATFPAGPSGLIWVSNPAWKHGNRRIPIPSRGLLRQVGVGCRQREEENLQNTIRSGKRLSTVLCCFLFLFDVYLVGAYVGILRMYPDECIRLKESPTTTVLYRHSSNLITSPPFSSLLLALSPD